MAKTGITGGLKVNAYSIISRAVDEGIGFGINRAHKHTDEPSREELANRIYNEVMLALTEVLDFGDYPDEPTDLGD